MENKTSESGKPLVSVIVITYNSGSTVVDTLESIKQQTYDNIELVVSDDCSSDNTREIVEEWLSDNSSFFASVVKVFSDLNSGVAVNGNRGVRASSGKYVKLIAGDDCLVRESIEKYGYFMEKNNIGICIADVELFSDDLVIPTSKIESYKKCFRLCKESREDKLKRLAYEYVLPGPGLFFKRQVYDEVGGFDERFPMSEEVPFAMRVLKAGYDIVPLDEKLVRYRYSGDSLSQHNGKKLGNRRWFEDNRRIFYTYQLPELIKSFRWLKAYSKMVQYERTNLAYKDGLFPVVGVGILCVINPYTYYRLVRKVWGRFRKLRNTSYTQWKI